MSIRTINVAPIPYQGLRFSFGEMLREIESMRELSRRFIEADSYERIFVQWRNQLSSLRTANLGQEIFWTIQEADSIQTIASEGEYEARNGGKGLSVFGRVSSKWQIHLPAEGAKKKASPSPTFVLLGLASTKVTIWTCETPPKEIARWTIEVGDAASPGCHFHTQIDLDDSDNKFPKALSVPRFPGVLHTPMDALEFLISELFQDRWHQVSSQRRDVVGAWGNCQRSRIIRLLEWQRDRLKETRGSPWTVLKRQKPGLDMLMGER
jgi:hypothetical protein